jgi:tetratricopeptide (TPR) repeat protein
VKYLPQHSGIRALLVVLGVWLSVSGCARNLTSETPATPDPRGSYQSRIEEAPAKALFAYSQFRLLGSENRWSEALAELRRAILLDPGTAYLHLVLARAYLHTDQTDQAIETLDALLKRAPDQLEGRELLGDVYSYRQDYSAAEEQYRYALSLAPESQQLQLRLAMIQAKLGQTAAAITVLENLLESHPDAQGARLALARFYAENQQQDEAMATYRRLLQAAPGQQRIVLEYGKMLEAEDAAAAQQLYLQTLDVDPQAAEVRRRLARLYLRQQQPQAALEQLQQVRQQFPANRELMQQIALLNLDLENWAAAESEYRALLADPSAKKELTFYLAMALAGQNRDSEAIAELEKVGPQNPLFGDAQLQLAYLQNREGQLERAVATLERAREQGVEQPELYYYLTAFLGDLDQYQRAQLIAEAAVERYPQDVRLLYQMGILYEKQNQRSAAVKMMEQVIALAPEHADALNFLAYHQAEQGIELELALERAQRALASKRSSYILDTLGWVYYKLGRYEEGRRHLEDAQRLQPEDPVIVQHLGDLYRALQLDAEAIELYRRFLRTHPKAEQVKDKLHQLLQKEG